MTLGTFQAQFFSHFAGTVGGCSYTKFFWLTFINKCLQLILLHPNQAKRPPRTTPNNNPEISNYPKSSGLAEHSPLRTVRTVLANHPQTITKISTRAMAAAAQMFLRAAWALFSINKHYL